MRFLFLHLFNTIRTNKHTNTQTNTQTHTQQLSFNNIDIDIDISAINYEADLLMTRWMFSVSKEQFKKSKINYHPFALNFLFVFSSIRQLFIINIVKIYSLQCVIIVSLENPGIQDFSIPKSRDWKNGPGLETLFRRHLMMRLQYTI